MNLIENVVGVLGVSWYLATIAIIIAAGVRDLGQSKRDAVPKWSVYGSPFVTTALLSLSVQLVIAAFVGSESWNFMLIAAGAIGIASTGSVFLAELRRQSSRWKTQAILGFGLVGGLVTSVSTFVLE